MTSRRSPTVLRRRLGIELRQRREIAGLTIEQVAEALECSRSKISRMETGQVSASPRDVRDMLEIYNVRGERQVALVEVAREAKKKAWWHEYDERIVSYIGMEAAAASIRQYEALIVPGLLQTPEYAKAVIRSVNTDLSPEEYQARLKLRMTRQSLLKDAHPPRYHVVLDEAVLRRPIGGQEVMREQLNLLIDSAEYPNITLQILPFAIGEHSGLTGSFTTLNFDDPADPPIVYLEHFTGDFHLENREEVQRYVSLFDRVSRAAFEPDDSVAYLIRLAETT